MLDWMRRLSTFSKVVGLVGAICAAIVSFAAAWPIVEPYMLAHRAYVISQVGVVQATTNDLLRWKLEDASSKLKADREGWMIQMQKENDPQTKALIQNRIEQLLIEERRNNERLATVPRG